MSIRFKLVSIFLLISIAPIAFLSVTGIQMSRGSLREEIGSKFENMAVEKARAIETILNSKIEETVILATHPLVIDALRKANGHYRGRTDDEALLEIAALDHKWISQKGKTPKAKEIVATQLSAFFRRYQDRNDEKYGEIFVTDAKGANVAMTKTLSDYYQADESWWKESFAGGKGAVFIDDRGYDESVGAIVAGAVVPVRDGGEVLGILKINYKVIDIINVAADVGKNIAIAIARNSGSLVISPGVERPLTTTGPEKRIMGKIKGGWVLGVHDGKKTIMGYAPISVPIYSRILPVGAERGVKGEKWHGTIWFMLLDIEQDIAFAAIDVMTRTYLIGDLVLILTVVVVALTLARKLSRPIQHLREGTEVIATGNLSHRLTAKRKDEIGDLARAFNIMTVTLQETEADRKRAEDALRKAHDELEEKVEKRTAELKNEITEHKRTGEKTMQLQEELAHVDRLSVMGEMAAGLAHEISQPLAAVVNFAQGCVRRLRSGKTKPDELLDALKQISVQAERAGEIIHRIRGFVGKEEPKMTSVDVNAAIREATGLLEFEAREHAVTLNLDLANPLPKVRGNTIQIQQVILNLAHNGMEAMSENGSTPRLLTIRSSATKSGAVEIAVHDNQYGVSTESLELMFKSFLTTKTGGLGLGLSICRSIVESHGGRLWVTTDGVNDTAFRFTLPVA